MKHWDEWRNCFWCEKMWKNYYQHNRMELVTSKLNDSLVLPLEFHTQIVCWHFKWDFHLAIAAFVIVVSKTLTYQNKIIFRSNVMRNKRVYRMVFLDFFFAELFLMLTLTYLTNTLNRMNLNSTFVSHFVPFKLHISEIGICFVLLSLLAWFRFICILSFSHCSFDCKRHAPYDSLHFVSFSPELLSWMDVKYWSMFNRISNQ